MSRAARLLHLVQILRRHRRPVTGAVLAAELGISLRTLYRDIAALQDQGATIEGEAGLGYVLQAGFMLPPLMFSQEEIEALVLGSRWVAKRGDGALAAAARDGLAKILAVLPPDLRSAAEHAPLLVGPGPEISVGDTELGAIRTAIRAQYRLIIQYQDGKGQPSERTIWPFVLAYFENVRVIAAWCELRQDFRHFRTDRITALTVTETRYPRRRGALLAEWRATLDIPPQ